MDRLGQEWVSRITSSDAPDVPVIGGADVNRCARYEKALLDILALDLGKTPTGRDDFYTGPDRFFQAWLIADRALNGELPASPDALDPPQEKEQ